MNLQFQTSKAPFRWSGEVRRGFSLIEMVLALGLVALIVGIGAIGYSSGQEERVLREAASKIEAMASRGHAMSILHQKAFWLRIEEDRVVLVGADTSPSFKSSEDDEAWTDWDEVEESKEKVYDEYQTEAFISLRRWGAADGDWSEANDDDGPVLWSFQSTGLCEPVSIRVQSAESWIVMHMHPLTARVEEEEMSIE